MYKHIAASTSSAVVCLGGRHPAPSGSESRFIVEVLFMLSFVLQMRWDLHWHGPFQDAEIAVPALQSPGLENRLLMSRCLRYKLARM